MRPVDKTRPRHGRFPRPASRPPPDSAPAAPTEPAAHRPAGRARRLAPRRFFADSGAAPAAAEARARAGRREIRPSKFRGIHPETPPGSVRRSFLSPLIYRNPRPAREIRPVGRRRAAFVDHFVLLRFIGIRVRRGKSVPRVVAGQRSSVMPFSFDLSESTPGAGNPSRGSPPGSVRRSWHSPRSAVQKVISIEKFRRATRKTCFSPDEIYVSRLKYTCFKGGCLYWRTHWKRTLPRAMYQGI